MSKICNWKLPSLIRYDQTHKYKPHSVWKSFKKSLICHTNQDENFLVMFIQCVHTRRCHPQNWDFLPRGALIIAVAEDWFATESLFLSNFNLDFLKLPLRFLGVGCCCKIITLSSRCRRSSSRSANSASRCFKRSSIIFCSRCLSSSTASLLRSS